MIKMKKLIEFSKKTYSTIYDSALENETLYVTRLKNGRYEISSSKRDKTIKTEKELKSFLKKHKFIKKGIE